MTSVRLDAGGIVVCLLVLACVESQLTTLKAVLEWRKSWMVPLIWRTIS